MGNILAMAEGSITSEITSLDEIDHVFQEMLAKSLLRDFHEI